MKKLITVSGIILLFLVSTNLQVWAKWKPKPTFLIKVVSSELDQVSGGDARLHIEVPRTVPLHKVKVTVNGIDQRNHFKTIPGTRTLTGVIGGLEVGENTVSVKPNGRGSGRPQPVNLTLINHPVTGPIFSGPHQHPFICSVQDQGLGQPLVDDEYEGFPVYAGEEIIGYSKNCSATTLVQYLYKSSDGNFKPYTLGGDRPADTDVPLDTSSGDVSNLLDPGPQRPGPTEPAPSRSLQSLSHTARRPGKTELFQG